ncbi:MAG: hypothetical protein WCA44_07285 [Acidobacteriaceae bacterium]
MSQTVWKCEQLRAGQVTDRVTFDSEKQASEFIARMREMQPDIFWRVEPVDAWRVWN